LHHIQYDKVVQAVVDGPYGSSFAPECLGGADVAVGVAGGSGIAVVYPLICRLAIACGDTKTPKKMVMMWIVREESDLLWLPDGWLDDLSAAGVEIVTYVTSAAKCRPDMKEHLRTIAEQESIAHNGLRMGVVVSGPSGMVRDVRNGCAMLMRRGDDVNVVAEKFGW
jgi:NAD(P)H-flavin reductase